MEDVMKDIAKKEKIDPGGQKEKRIVDKNTKKQKRKKRRKIFQRILLSILGILIVFCIAILVKITPVYEEAKTKVYQMTADGKLTTESTFKREGNTEIYDHDDNLIGKLGSEYYEYVKVADISSYIKNGYIAQEDRRFAIHHGVDFIGTTRAALTLAKNHGKITQGGSTITQQVVKNNLLTQEKTFERKILEIMLSFQLEKHYTKSEIMEFYCNSNYYGNGCYGIEAASQYYYGKSAKDITLAEAAILVGVSNSPNNYNPVADYDKAMEKKQQVLDSMFECEFISQDEYDVAKEEKPEIVQKKEEAAAESYQITYAIHCAALQLMKEDGFQFKYSFTDQDEYASYNKKYQDSYNNMVTKIRGGGYLIYTTLDSEIQNKLQKSMDNGLSGFTDTTEDGRYELQGAAVCIDNTSQMVVAVVGGRGTEDSFNRGYQAVRQPGSAIKPLLDYGPAIDSGVVTPSTYMTDQKVEVSGYAPSNSNGRFLGDMSVREALARSVNTIAFQLYLKNGSDTAFSYLDKLQMSTVTYADTTNLASSIGGFTDGVTVSDMAKAYAAIENDGKYQETTCIRKIDSRKDGTLYELAEDPDEHEVFLEDTAFILQDMMQGTFNESYGTAADYKNENQVYAGKTGTTNSNKDAWFCGFSTYYTTAVWVGCDTPKKVEGLYGGTYPAAIWSDFMNGLHENLEKKDFSVPDTIFLTNSNGDKKNVDYTENIYYSRPSEYDYTSGQLEKKKEKLEKEQRIKNEIKKATDAVTDFEEITLDKYSDVESFQTKYNEVLTLIDAIEDDSKKSDLKNRLAEKYKSYSDEVYSKWKAAQEAEAAAEQEKRNAATKEDAQKTIEKAASQLENARISVVQWYIDHLNSRTMQSSVVEEMISDAEAALEKGNGYSKYSQLRSALTAAENYARKLPTQDQINNELNQTTTPDESQYPESDTDTGSASGSTTSNRSSD